MRELLRRLLMLIVVLGCLSPVAPARATVVIPLAPEELAEEADAIVTGTVTRIRSRWNREQSQITTTIVIAVDEVLKGEVPDGKIKVTHHGGSVGDSHAWIQGNPQFRRGERVLVFLTEQPDGSLRVSHLYQGKFSLLTDPATGDELAVRDPNPPGVRALPRPDGAAAWSGDADGATVAELKERVRRTAHRKRPGKRVRGVEAETAAASTQDNDAFTFFSNAARWFEPDSGLPVRLYLNWEGEPAAPSRGYDQARAAFAAWSSVPGSSLRIVDGGITYAAGLLLDNASAISFRDPYWQIGSFGYGCKGILAVAGYFYNTASTKIINGKKFYRIIEADLVTADGWQGCGFYESFQHLAEVLTHEVGHMLGFDHSKDKNATMHATAHFDGRGASLMPSDQAGVVFLYPGSGSGGGSASGSGGGTASFTLSVVGAGTGSGTVTSSPKGIKCGSDCSESYAPGTAVTLTAKPDRGSTFAGWSGACSGTGACTVSMTAARSVIATFTTAAGTGAAAGADLVLTAVGNPPGRVAAGGRLALSDTVRNEGASASSRTHVAYYLSSSGNVKDRDVKLRGKRTISALSAGATSSGQVTVTVPRKVAPGTYRVVACVESARGEKDNANNCRASVGSVTVDPR